MNKVLMYCQGLLGVGHLTRFINIANSINGEVTIVYGGEHVHGIDIPKHVKIIQQPPVRSDRDFSVIHSIQNPNEPLDLLQEERQKILIKAIEELKPVAFVIDSFPFSRRKFAPEIIPAIELIKKKYPSCKIITSLRDFNYNRPDQANYANKVLDKLKKYIDYILIHSDESATDRDNPLYFHHQLPIPFFYTGYVTNPHIVKQVKPMSSEPFNVLVQIGGGRVGNELFKVVHDALPHLKRKIRIKAFRGAFKPDINGFKPNHPDFQFFPFGSTYFRELEKADLLISQCGYNSMTDVLTSRVKWMTLPFTVTGEQTFRANWLLKTGILANIFPENADSKHVAQMIDDNLNVELAKDQMRNDLMSKINLKGAENTARMIEVKFEKAKMSKSF